jgi:hypothetical protein
MFKELYMKRLMTFALLALSLNTFAAGKCDLSANDHAVNEVNQRMDNAQMRGEDHLIALTELKRERLDLILACVQADLIEGIQKSELKELKEDIKAESDIMVRELNESIRVSIENDRIGMATELMMERDLEILNTQNQIDRINKILE